MYIYTVERDWVKISPTHKTFLKIMPLHWWKKNTKLVEHRLWVVEIRLLFIFFLLAPSSLWKLIKDFLFFFKEIDLILVYFLEIKLSFHVFEKYVCQTFGSLFRMKKPTMHIWKIVWGFSAFMCLGIFPS